MLQDNWKFWIAVHEPVTATKWRKQMKYMEAEKDQIVW